MRFLVVQGWGWEACFQDAEKFHWHGFVGGSFAWNGLEGFKALLRWRPLRVWTLIEGALAALSSLAECQRIRAAREAN